MSEAALPSRQIADMERSAKSCAHPLTRFAGRITAWHGARRPVRVSENDFASVDVAAPVGEIGRRTASAPKRFSVAKHGGGAEA